MTDLAEMEGRAQTHAKRRRWLLRTLGAAALGTASVAWKRDRPHDIVPLTAPQSITTLIAFTAALFGHEMTEQDRADLEERFALLQTDPVFARDLDSLAGHVEFLARTRTGLAFDRCGALSQDNIINDIMSIDAKSHVSHLLSRISQSERDYYRMRWSAVAQISWLYRHSPVAWRARGYRHWPGAAGERGDLVLAGPAYP